MILDPTNGNHIYFSINQNGEIRTTTKPLDYEQLSSSNFQLDLIVLVKDMPTNYQQKTGTATVIVNVRGTITSIIISKKILYHYHR